MRSSFFAHLPAVKSDLSVKQKFGPGHLTYLDFDSWFQLDGTFGESRKNYEKNKPLFLKGEIDNGIQNPDQIVESFNHQILLCYWAMVLGTGHYLIPNPQMSCSYYRIEQDQGVLKYDPKGSFEREWIVFGDTYQFVFDNKLFDYIDDLYLFLKRSRDFFKNHPIMHSLRTLQFTANPEFCMINGELSYFNGFIHCMAALENILLSFETTKKHKLSITEAFGRNAAAFTVSDFEKLPDTINYYSELYRVRSKMIHGEASNLNYTKRAEEGFKIGRILLTKIVKHLIALNNIDFQFEFLPENLLNASKDNKSHQDLQQLIQKGGE